MAHYIPVFPSHQCPSLALISSVLAQPLLLYASFLMLPLSGHERLVEMTTGTVFHLFLSKGGAANLVSAGVILSCLLSQPHILADHHLTSESRIINYLPVSC